MPDVVSETMRARIAAALEAIQGEGPLRACAHVLVGGAPAFLCVFHPAAGASCAKCATEHDARHGGVLCSFCDAPITGEPARHDPMRIPVRELFLEGPSGVSRAVLSLGGAPTAELALVGLVVCERCKP